MWLFYKFRIHKTTNAVQEAIQKRANLNFLEGLPSKGK